MIKKVNIKKWNYLELVMIKTPVEQGKKSHEVNLKLKYFSN